MKCRWWIALAGSTAWCLCLHPCFDVDASSGFEKSSSLDAETQHLRSPQAWIHDARQLSTTQEQLCPVSRHYPPQKYGIQPFPDDNPHDHVEDDLGEISSLGFASYTDIYGQKYAYVVSDKEQFSLKVIRFNRNDNSNYKGPWTGNATVVAVYKLNVDYSNDDWEDLAVGPCSDAYGGIVEEACIYIGNFGNNPRGSGSSYVPRHEVEIFKFREPPFTGPDNTPLSQFLPVTTIQFAYTTSFDDTALDAEAMFVDWTGVNGQGKGDIYIVLKGRCGKGVQRLPVSSHKYLSPGQIVNVGKTQKVTEDPPRQQDHDCGDSEFDVWQGADMNRNGTLIAMITQGYPPRVYFYAREHWMTMADALSSPSCDFVSSVSSGLPNERKHEAVAFVDAKGSSIAETTECLGGRDCTVPIYFYELIFPDSVPKSTNQTAAPSDAWQEVTLDTFEGGSFGSYQTLPSGVLNVYPTETHVCDGQYSVHLSGGRGVSSSFSHSNDHDCSRYSILRVSFQMRFNDDIEHLTTLFLELSLSGGRGYMIVHSIAKDVQLQDSENCHQTTVLLYALWDTTITFHKPGAIALSVQCSVRE